MQSSLIYDLIIILMVYNERIYVFVVYLITIVDCGIDYITNLKYNGWDVAGYKYVWYHQVGVCSTVHNTLSANVVYTFNSRCKWTINLNWK